MLDDDSCLAIGLILHVRHGWMRVPLIRKGFVPSLVAGSLEIFVDNVSSADSIDNQLAESGSFLLGLADCLAKHRKPVLKKKAPCKVDGILFCNTLFLVESCHIGSLLDQLGIGNTWMICIVNQCGEDACELSKRIASNSIGMIMEVFVSLNVHIRCNNAAQQLCYRHADVTRVLKVVEGVFRIHESDYGHIFTELRTNVWCEDN
mmetsp:Transcript_18196/g.37516  ORF Transcript_18196/g.37516 Transcript_18196/m.37516 type:complete len:205 (+) Transcript_18196:445-1059(+)